MGNLISYLRVDLSWIHILNGFPTLPGGGSLTILFCALYTAIKSESFHAVLLYRLSRYAYLRRWKFISRFYYSRLQKRYGTSIAVTAEIEGGFRLPHPYGITIGGHVQMGKMVTVGQHVTIGGNFGLVDENGITSPIIGNWTWIAAGAVIAGPITVGDDVIVGANTVLTKSIGDHYIIGGIPAKIIRERVEHDHRNKIMSRYYGYPAGVRNSLTAETHQPNEKE